LFPGDGAESINNGNELTIDRKIIFGLEIYEAVKNK
jgi:hypothetical protein